MSRHGFHTVTLGCKLNRFDTAAIEAQLARRGFQPESDVSRASVVIVNTCTVTGKADAEARRRIRGLRRDNPGCRLLVTGCYAERDALALRAIPGVDRVFGNTDKSRLPEILDELGLTRPGPGANPARSELACVPELGDRGCDGSLELPEAVHFGERSRAFLKVQEGCDLSKVIRLFHSRKLRCIPVVDARKQLVGIVGRRDILTHYAAEL